MIWTIHNLTAFQQAFLPAGEPDQAAIEAHLRTRRLPPSPSRHQGFARYYYLLQVDPRISLGCIGTPLEDWTEPAMLLVGTRVGIGEFVGNRHLVGRKVLALTMKPFAWLQGQADQQASAALDAISFQLLDLERAEQSQERIRQQYQW